MNTSFKILTINPGSTSTKFGLFDDDVLVAEKKVDHSAIELKKYPKIIDQYSMRRHSMLDFLKERKMDPEKLSAVVGRGGFLRPIPSGTYKVDSRMIEDLIHARHGEHASNIGAILAYGFQWDHNIPAFIVDPPVVDEMDDVARLSGLKEIPRRSIWHALNCRAVVRLACLREKMNFQNENFVVAHLGGGITVMAMEKGRCIDVSNGLEAGPFTPERAGSLPSLELVDLCYGGKYKVEEARKMIVGQGGLVSYLGTSNVKEVENRIDQGDDYARLVFDSMGYQVAKEIGSLFVTLKGKVSRIILTGGIAKSNRLVGQIQGYVSKLAPVLVIPGEDELAALAQGGLRVLRGEETPKRYEVVEKQ